MALTSSLCANLRSSNRSFVLRLRNRPRERRTSSLNRARSFSDNDAQRRPTIIVPCNSVAHGTALAARLSLDSDRSEAILLGLPDLLTAAMVAGDPGRALHAHPHAA